MHGWLFHILWVTATALLWQRFCPESKGWASFKNFMILDTWPILIPYVAVKSVIQVARGDDLKLLPSSEIKQLE